MIDAELERDTFLPFKLESFIQTSRPELSKDVDVVSVAVSVYPLVVTFVF